MRLGPAVPRSARRLGRGRRHTCSVRPCASRLEHGEDIARQVQVEGELRALDDRGGHVGLRGRLQVPAVGIVAEPGGDRAEAVAEQQVGAPFVGRRREDDRAQRVQRPRERGGGDAAACRGAGRRARRRRGRRPPPRPGGSRCPAAASPRGSRARRAIIAISSTASSGEITQVSQPASACVASSTSSSIASVSAPRSSGVEHRVERGLRLGEGLHGQGDRAHGWRKPVAHRPR